MRFQEPQKINEAPDEADLLNTIPALGLSEVECLKKAVKRLLGDHPWLVLLEVG